MVICRVFGFWWGGFRMFSFLVEEVSCVNFFCVKFGLIWVLEGGMIVEGRVRGCRCRGLG